jgi:hypothetical protein
MLMIAAEQTLQTAAAIRNCLIGISLAVLQHQNQFLTLSPR